MKLNLKPAPAAQSSAPPLWAPQPYLPFRAGFPCYAQPIAGSGPYLYRDSRLFCAHTGDVIHGRHWSKPGLPPLIGYLSDSRFIIYDTLIPRITFQNRFFANNFASSIDSSPFLLAPTIRFDNALDLDTHLFQSHQSHLIRMHNSYTDDPYGALLAVP